MDKQGANADRVMNELSEKGLVPEAWGGNVPFVQVSALRKIAEKKAEKRILETP